MNVIFSYNFSRNLQQFKKNSVLCIVMSIRACYRPGLEASHSSAFFMGLSPLRKGRTLFFYTSFRLFSFHQTIEKKMLLL